jgi:hypothetical protein
MPVTIAAVPDRFGPAGLPDNVKARARFAAHRPRYQGVSWNQGKTGNPDSISNYNPGNSN